MTNDYETARRFCPDLSREPMGNGRWRYIIHTLEGRMQVSEGDFIIQGVAGEFYPCRADIFRATYEEVETTDEA